MKMLQGFLLKREGETGVTPVVQLVISLQKG